MISTIYATVRMSIFSGDRILMSIDCIYNFSFVTTLESILHQIYGISVRLPSYRDELHKNLLSRN